MHFGIVMGHEKQYWDVSDSYGTCTKITLIWFKKTIKLSLPLITVKYT